MAAESDPGPPGDVPPPATEEEAWEQASRLDGLPEEERLEVLSRWLRASLPALRGWAGFLSELFSSTPRARVLSQHLKVVGLPSGRRTQVVGRFSSFGEAHRHWSRWTEEDDRDELRLRLEALAYAERIAPDLEEFLLFFFRASDPTTYQPAAVVVGRHLHLHPPLQEYVGRYAEDRGVARDQLPELDGTRSRRRLLLVAAAASSRAARADEGTQSPEERLADPPLALDGSSEPPLEEPRDLPVYLTALELLVSGPGVQGERARDHARHVLGQVAVGERVRWDRAVARRWGRLLATLHECGEEWASQEGELLRAQWVAGALQRHGTPRSVGFGARVGALEVADELLRQAVHVGPEWSRTVARHAREELSGERALLATLRLSMWQARLYGGDPSALTERNGEGPGWRQGPLHAMAEVWMPVQQAHPGELLGPPGAREAHRSVRTLLEPISSRGRWFGLAEADRALYTFLLLDEMLHPTLPVRELQALLADLGSSARPGGSETPTEEDGTEVQSEPASWLVARVTEWEGERGEAFVDARLLHRLGDEALLVRLLPTGRTSELLPSLADALEHRFRLNLARDPEFSPEAFLLRMAIRKPHGSFYSILGALLGDRTYRNAEGAELPIRGWLEDLVRASDPPSDREEPSGASFRILEPFRTALSRAHGEKDLPQRLEALAALLTGGGEEHHRPEADPTSLVLALNGGRSRLHRSGSRPWAAVSPAALAAEVSAAAARLSEAVPLLSPETFQELEEAQILTHQVGERLRRLRHLLPPLLPAREAQLSDTLLMEIEGELRGWMGTLSSLGEVWRSTLDGDATVGESHWEVLARHAAAVADRPLRRASLRLLWGGLTRELGGRSAEAEPGAAPSQMGWKRDEAVLRWAVQRAPSLLPPEDRGEWLRHVSDRWQAMAEEAMASGFETRLVRLTRGKEGGILALRPEAEGILERLRLWFFDTYRIGDAMRISRAINARKGLGFVGSMPREVGAFFVHYSALWLALLVGAILMLDFGDAWTSMAEIGDVRGIAITFAVGVLGAFAYVGADLRQRVRDAPEDVGWRTGFARLGRVTVFLLACLVYTVGLVTLLWLLLSTTDEVVHGPGAVLHVVVWSGFALFVGVFFGLLAKRA